MREAKRALLLIKEVPLVESVASIDPVLMETEELIKIFAASIRTAEKGVVREERSAYGMSERQEPTLNIQRSTSNVQRKTGKKAGRRRRKFDVES